MPAQAVMHALALRRSRSRKSFTLGIGRWVTPGRRSGAIIIVSATG